ncbi:MAG: thiamine phosphate synthase [Muribaculaceae bacterium]|nr:thiamine phosphate synthase [Muribaculaceae bacterium]
MLQFITHTSDSEDYVGGAHAALQGGCRWIQLRMKDADDAEFISAGERLATLCSSANATFILDDRVHLVKHLKADGVHLGKNDMPIPEARKILGEGYIIGATANTIEDALDAVEKGADYIGVGPFRFTSTKRNLSPMLGIEGLKNIMKELRRFSDIPVVAIGGIEEEDIPLVMSSGVSGIALSGAILRSPDPVAATASILKTLNNENK